MGFKCGIVGLPNVGKSTLLNALAGREAAITSEFAGTTRDVIEVRMDIGGLAVTLLDTAGLRDSVDVIERIGIGRAIERAQKADLRVFLLETEGETFEVEAEPDDIFALGKADQRPGVTQAVSGKTGVGVDWLISAISLRLGARAASAGLLIRERQRIALQQAIVGLEAVEQLLPSALEFPELIAVELRRSLRALEIMVGRIDVESLLDEIFSSFCIGK